MLKRLNFTDRKRIPRGQVVLRAAADQTNSFTVDLPIDIVENPSTQVVYVDVTSAGSSEVVRYRPAVTTAGIARGPFPLGKLEWRRAIFDIKVVEVSAGNPGRILRRANGIKAAGAGRGDSEDTSHALFEVARRPLGQRAWLLECRSTVTLVINESLMMTDDDFCSHPAVVGLVFPEICQRAIEWAIVAEGRHVTDLSSAENDPASLWLRFALQESPGEPPPEAPREGWHGGNRDELDTWIEDVVGRVCAKHDFLSVMLGKALESIS